MTEKKDRYKVAENFNINGYVIKDIETGKSYSVIEALAKIMNDMESLRIQLGY